MLVAIVDPSDEPLNVSIVFYTQINEKMTKVSDDYHKMVKSV
jgi:hypothetical protein